MRVRYTYGVNLKQTIVCYWVFIDSHASLKSKNLLLFTGLGFGGETKTLRKCTIDYFKSYVRDGRCDVLIFSSEFTSEERKILHDAARVCQLKSKSRGSKDNRCVR